MAYKSFFESSTKNYKRNTHYNTNQLFRAIFPANNLICHDYIPGGESVKFKSVAIPVKHQLVKLESMVHIPSLTSHSSLAEEDWHMSIESSKHVIILFRANKVVTFYHIRGHVTCILV